jgi:hypothetical protein
LSTNYYVDGSVGSDSNAGTSPGSGSAWATVAHALATIASGDTAYVKASATYSIGTGLSFAVGTYNQVTSLVGYTTTPGDGGRATIRATAAITGLTMNNRNTRVANFILDGNSLTGTVGVSAPGGTFSVGLINLKIQNWSSYGINGGSEQLQVINCEVSGCNASGAAVNAAQSTLYGCSVHGNNVGVSGLSSGALVLNCRIYGNSSHGITAADSRDQSFCGNTFHGNGGDGIRIDSFYQSGSILNNIFTSNGGYGLNASALSSYADPLADYNWFGTGSLANTSGARNGILAGTHDLSGDPQYVSAGTGDFTPQNAAVQAGSG